MSSAASAQSLGEPAAPATGESAPSTASVPAATTPASAGPTNPEPPRATADASAAQPETQPAAPVTPAEPPRAAAGQDAGPTINLPAEPPPPAATDAQVAAEAHGGPRAGFDARTAAHSGTTLGGYAELHLNVEHVTGPGSRETTMDFHRFVLFLAHEWTERLRFYSELEVEHAVVAPDEDGELELEQAYVEYELAKRAVRLRAGLVLVPMGYLNQWHEPPTFHGVERPVVDTVIIPSTWREGALGIVGEPVEGLRYELYVMSGLSAAGFSAAKGIRSGRLGTAEARADGIAVAGRVEYEPTLSVTTGVSAYYGIAGPNAELFDAKGVELDIAVPVFGVALDARAERNGFEARGEFAYFHIGDTAALRNASDAGGKSLGLDVASALYGVYGELAYDVLHPLNFDEQLLPFVRIERLDTLASVAGRKKTSADDAYAMTELALGLTFRPIQQVAFKSDFRLSDPDGPTKASGRIDLGVGVMF